MWKPQTTPQSPCRRVGSWQGGILTTPLSVPPVAWGVVAAHCLAKQLWSERHGRLGTGGVISRQVCVQALTRTVAASREAPQAGEDPAQRQQPPTATATGVTLQPTWFQPENRISISVVAVGRTGIERWGGSSPSRSCLPLPVHPPATIAGDDGAVGRVCPNKQSGGPGIAGTEVGAANAGPETGSLGVAAECFQPYRFFPRTQGSGAQPSRRPQQASCGRLGLVSPRPWEVGWGERILTHWRCSVLRALWWTPGVAATSCGVP